MAETTTITPGTPISMMRALRSVLAERIGLGRGAGMTFGNTRNVRNSLGYKEILGPADYWDRYERDGVAARVVEAFPEGTWRGAGEVYEVDDPKTETDFEKAWRGFAERLTVWPTMLRTDILTGLGQYAVLLIGAPGDLKDPLPKTLKLDDVAFLMPYSQRDVTVKNTDNDKKSARFGEVVTYEFKNPGNSSLSSVSSDKTVVHWTRVIHVPERMLDDNQNGQPRLARVWNRLDDLEKVVGAGSEAFWLRAHQGYQFNLDKELELDADGEKALEEEVDEFMNGMRRAVRTRGVDLKALGSDVAIFDRNVSSIVGLISAATKIPQRILMGSEQGQLASQQDRVNWAQRVQDRRTQFAEPYMIRPFVNRLIAHKALPEVSYKIWWPEVFDLSDDERAVIAGRWAEVNQKMKKTVVTVDEIRDRILGLPPLTDEQIEREKKQQQKALPPETPKSTRTEQPTIKGNNPT